MSGWVRKDAAAAKASAETDDRLARWQLGERALADAAHAFSQILRLSWRGGPARRLASFFENGETRHAREQGESSTGGLLPDGETEYDGEPDDVLTHETAELPHGAEQPDSDVSAEKAEELLRGAELLPSGRGREPDPELAAQPKAKELPCVAEPPSQRQRIRDSFDPAKRAHPKVGGIHARRGHGGEQVGDYAASPAVGEMEGWFKDLAQSVGSMGRRSGSSFDSWSIHLPMDPEVLPDTELRIRASPEWMALRFCTQSPVSVRLISEHTPVLQRSLEAILDMKGQIDIDLE